MIEFVTWAQLQELPSRGLPRDLKISIRPSSMSHEDKFLIEWHFAEYLRDNLKFDHN